MFLQVQRMCASHHKCFDTFHMYVPCFQPPEECISTLGSLIQAHDLADCFDLVSTVIWGPHRWMGLSHSTFCPSRGFHALPHSLMKRVSCPLWVSLRRLGGRGCSPSKLWFLLEHACMYVCMYVRMYVRTHARRIWSVKSASLPFWASG
jgi:hypothetical protein